MKVCLSRFILIAIGICIGLSISELYLRFFGYQGNNDRLNTIYLPALGTVRKDSWILEFSANPSRSSHVSIRGQIIPIKKRPHEQRILFIGDSGTEAPYLPIADTYPLVFKRLLNHKKPNNKITVINAGVWGMTTIDEYHFLKEELIYLGPDVVILGLFMANDINFNLGHSRTRISHQPSSDLIAYLKDRSALVHFLYLSALRLNSRYHLFSPIDFGATSLVPVELTLIDSYGFHMLNYPLGEVATYMQKSSSLIDQAFQILKTMFIKFKIMAAENNFQFRVILIPTPSAVAERLTILHHPQVLSDINAQGIPLEESDLDFQKPTRRVLEICAELDIPCLNPTRSFKRIGLSVFFPEDEHLTKTGHEILARQLMNE